MPTKTHYRSTPPRRNGAVRRFIRFALVIALVSVGELAFGQTPLPPEKLIDKVPFDEIVLTDEFQGKRFEIEEVTFPDGNPPTNPDPSSTFQFRFYTDVDDLYEVSWKDIREFIPFSKRVANETRMHINAGKFGDAYDNLTFLKANYPKYPSLDALYHEFLYRNATAFISAGRTTEALALIEELSFSEASYRPTPADRTAKELVDFLADKLIGDTLAAQQYESTRNWIARFIREYGDNALPSVVARKNQLAEVGKRLVTEALGHIDQKRFRKGKELLREAMRAWPENPEVARVAKRIDDEFPTVVVAVRSFPAKADMTSLTNWDARRWGRLTDQRLFEYSRLGAEGGDYACTIGKAGISDDGSEFVIEIAPSRAVSRGLTGYDVSQMLLEIANPESASYSPAWARLVDRVRVDEVNQVRAHFRRPHPVPTAFLPISLSTSPAAQLEPAFKPNPNTAAVPPEERSFIPGAAGRASANRIVELVERRFDDPREMANALIKGEVEIVDRIHLGDLPRLSMNSQFSLRQYLLPTTHFIAVNIRNPYFKNRNFRRALTYSINAQTILDGIVLDGQRAPGCRVISGPFPAGTGATDPVAYAYDDNIEPRPYDPRLGLILLALARRDLEASGAISATTQPIVEKKSETTPPATDKPDADAKPAPPPPRPKIPLVLAYPQTLQARAICGAIGAQLGMVGIDCKLRPLPPGEVEDPSHDYDLLYVEAALWEPLADTRKIFASSGVAPTTSPYVNADLRRLDDARSWQEVATRLQQLHRTIFDEVPLIPLFQTYDFAAVRSTVKNVAQKPIWLYGNIADWQLAAEARAGDAQ
jgi:hypothetical protein